MWYVQLYFFLLLFFHHILTLILLTSSPSSQPLPSLSPMQTDLPSHLFGEAVMVLEFLHHFGPVFSLKDAIHGAVTYGE